MYEVKVSGMTCGGCVNSVTKALKSMDSKAEVKVDLQGQMIQIETEKSQEAVKTSIEEAGFDVLNLSAK